MIIEFQFPERSTFFKFSGFSTDELITITEEAHRNYYNTSMIIVSGELFRLASLQTLMDGTKWFGITQPIDPDIIFYVDDKNRISMK